MTGTEEIFLLHNEFITHILKQLTGEERKTYDYLFCQTLVKDKNNWHDLNGVLQEQLVRFYTTERAALAFDTKDYSHLICKKSDNKVYGRIYSGSSQSKQYLYHENELTQKNIKGITLIFPSTMLRYYLLSTGHLQFFLVYRTFLLTPNAFQLVDCLWTSFSFCATEGDFLLTSPQLIFLFIFLAIVS